MIKASKRVKRWCSKGYRLPFAHDGERAASALFRTACPPRCIPHDRPWTQKHQSLTDMIQVLLTKHVIEPVSPRWACFFNVFLRPKPSGSWRVILDVFTLNEFLVLNATDIFGADEIKQQQRTVASLSAALPNKELVMAWLARQRLMANTVPDNVGQQPCILVKRSDIQEGHRSKCRSHNNTQSIHHRSFFTGIHFAQNLHLSLNGGFFREPGARSNTLT